MASSDLRQELDCSICLNIYTDPVNLRCGHNFCRVCIDRVLDIQKESGGYSCPECREEFQDRPELQRNVTLRNIVGTFRSAQPDQEETGIFCTYCLHSPVPAVKGCLHCEAFLCNDHLRVHSKSPEHVLTHPTISLEKRKCSVHKKILEYYCSADSTCICVSCSLIGGHQGHKVETLHEATEKKKKKLIALVPELSAERQETERRAQSLQALKVIVFEKATDITQRVTVLFRDLKRQLEDLEKKVLTEISKQEKQISFSLSDKIQQLEIKKDELSRKMDHIEEMCNMTDPLTFLQESDTADYCDTKKRYIEDRETRHYLSYYGENIDVTGISHMLHAGLSDMIRRVTTFFNVEEAADISLDVNTAHNNLIISNNKKKAYRTSKTKNYPESPHRFARRAQVLSSQSFSSGRHYWEVDVSKSNCWIVGMCYPSIERSGLLSFIGNSNKSWGLIGDEKRCSVKHNNKEDALPGKIPSHRVRVYLDYKAGRLSFYDLSGPIRQLHTFTATFTEPLHAVLRVKTGQLEISVPYKMS